MAEPNYSPAVGKWLGVVHSYDNEFKKWDARVTKIIRRYRDDVRNNGTTGYESARFNILWSNVQTLVPAVFSKLPKASVARRFSDNDAIGRVAAMLLERTLDYEIEHYPDYRAAMKNAVEDRFLGGRGVAWVRYDPHIKKQDVPEDGYQITEDVENEGNEYGAAFDPANPLGGTEGAPEEIEYECAPVDYVHWRDFGHSPARTWEEVTCVWRWAYLSKEALKERFGEESARKIPTNESPDGLTKYGQGNRTNDKAKICELWDKESGRVYWFHESYPELLDERDDPLGLDGFFPCAKPLYATTTSDNLIPIPDFVLYQDQANELDILTDRIDGLVKALRVRGVYDASQPALQRLLTEGDNNTLVPVDKWAAFSEKGGLKGSIDLLPMDVIANTLLQCYQAQANIKGQIFEITGIADIIRGNTQASETATAQQIKGQYAGLRLRSMQESVALFASELLRIKAQIVCSKFQPQTILAYAAADQLSPEDQQLIPQALQLLTNNPLRSFRVEVASDSLVQLDEQQIKQERVEFLNSLANFMREALPVGQSTPELVPMLMALIKFGVAGFKQARPIEGVIDTALQQLTLKAQQAAQNPQPNPEMQKIQAEQQAAQIELQAKQASDQARMQADMQIEQAKIQMQADLERQRMDHEAQLKMQELAANDQLERWKEELDAATKIMVARISANPGADIPILEAQNAAVEQITSELGNGVREALDRISDTANNMAMMHGESMQHMRNAMQMIAAPKRIVRGPDGKAIAIETQQ